MKTFEHEVLNFNTSNRKGQEAMKEALRKWGTAGYELISATPDMSQPQGYTLFLKREIKGGGKPVTEGAA